MSRFELFANSDNSPSVTVCSRKGNCKRLALPGDRYCDVHRAEVSKFANQALERYHRSKTDAKVKGSHREALEAYHASKENPSIKSHLREIYAKNIRRDEGIWETSKEYEAYSIVAAKRAILQFISGAEYMVAFEPKSCDRNRLRELLNADEWEIVEGKLCDFRQDLFDKFFTTNHEDGSNFYLCDGMQATIVMHMFGDGINTPDILTTVPDILQTQENKCESDVVQLTLLCLLLASFILKI